MRFFATGLLTLLLAGPPAAGAGPNRTAHLERGNFREFSQTNADHGSISTTRRRAYEGRRSAKATYSGGGRNGYARAIYNVSWATGDDVWYGAAFYLPEGFLASVQDQVDLMRWDNWPSDPRSTDRGGISIFGSDKRARLLRFNAGGSGTSELVGPFGLPEGRWFWLEIHQRLGTPSLSEAYLNGWLVGRSTRPNSYGRRIDRIRFGIVAVGAGVQTRPLTLFFDRAAVSRSPLGPLLACEPSDGPSSWRRNRNWLELPCGPFSPLR